MPVSCGRYLYHDWYSGLLLLWELCCFTSTRVGRCPFEKGLLWLGFTRSMRQHTPLRTRKLNSSFQGTSNKANESQIAAKYVFVRMLRGSHHLTDPTFRHWATWLSCTGGTTLIAYVIASAIPVFGGLVSLIGALLGTLMCFQPFGAMWLYDNWRNARTMKWYAMVAWCTFVIVSGFFLMIGGTYGSVVDIKNAYAESGGSSPWSCADNSNST